MYGYGNNCYAYNNCSSLSRGARAGIGVGVSIFVILLVIILGSLIAKRRSRPFNPQIRPGYNTGYTGGPSQQQPMQPGFNNFSQPYGPGPQAGYQPGGNYAGGGNYQPPSGPPPSSGYVPPEGASSTGKYQPPAGPPPTYKAGQNASA
ncbi:hypothetical protein MPSI1_000139 [Malassezia psittaci]|uniref:Uncharacterized protein n=1 Tax=Malassezia psittaci TaxID=1821823 RepID=A0AAF0F7L9_9BASI|nr:hypothetical protein MPSI1_000139 [Malassezia psittaci]